MPRKEPASGHAGGKVVKVDRVEFIWLSDPQTAQSALVAGEIDYLENPQPDFLPILESTPGIKLDDPSGHGHDGHPPAQPPASALQQREGAAGDALHHQQRRLS